MNSRRLMSNMAFSGMGVTKSSTHLVGAQYPHPAIEPPASPWDGPELF
jgi:hypothetical protein